jgi:hypothetical protein
MKEGAGPSVFRLYRNDPGMRAARPLAQRALTREILPPINAVH